METAGMPRHIPCEFCARFREDAPLFKHPGVYRRHVGRVHGEEPHAPPRVADA